MAEKKDTKLARHIGLLALTFYGVGDILGAGVYGLIGKAAGEMGNGVWLGFLISAVAAAACGLTYASLGSRYPKAGGSAFVLQKAFGLPLLSYLIGMAVFFSGLTSMATSSKAFAGYLESMIPFINPWLGSGLFIGLLTLIVFTGIKQSMWFNILCTGIEVSGLLFVVVTGLSYFGKVDYFDMTSKINPDGGIHWGMAFSGAVLTFFSFVGFEDMLNVSEEVKDPAKTLPKGLLYAVLISSVIYLAISIAAVSVIPPQILAKSNQPLVDVVKVAAPWFPVKLFSVISLFALANTALLNFIMGSRLMYGMARQGLLPKILSKVHSKRKTPYLAILLIMCILAILVAMGNITNLAKSTSALLLTSYFLMNLALLKLKKTDKEHSGKFEVYWPVPVFGALICLAMLVHTQWNEVIVGLSMLGIALLLYLFLRPKAESLSTVDED